METRPSKKMKKSLSDGDDRISNLPDDVLIHILSFIPTMESVATFILSKRWQNLWKHVPILTFDETLPPFNPRRKTHRERFANSVNRLLDLHAPEALQKLSLTCNCHKMYDVRDWITRSIMRNIQSLYLTICDYSSAPAHRLPVRLPSNLFTCATLETLVVKGTNQNIIVHIPTIVCLPKLKTMELVGLRYQDDQKDPSGKLISGCSSLESLLVEDQTLLNDYVGFHTISSTTLKDVEFRMCEPPCLLGYNPEIFCSSLRRLNLSTRRYFGKPISVPVNVFSCKTLEQLVLNGHFVICATRTICLPNLTFLALNGVEFKDDGILSRLISSCASLESLAVKIIIVSELNISSCTLKVIEVELYCSSKPGHKLVIDAPAMKCLKLSTKGYVDCQIEDLASLEQADISMTFSGLYSSEYDSSVLNNVFQALRHVKSLKVCHNNHYYSHVDVLPMFNSLTDLDITICGWLGCELFQQLIKNSTKLQNLTFELGVGQNVETIDDWCWRNLNKVPACLLSSLRSVSIRRFNGNYNQQKMAFYILENARIMEKMEVCLDESYYFTKAMKKELCKKMLNVPRGSEKCKVVIK